MMSLARLNRTLPRARVLALITLLVGTTACSDDNGSVMPVQPPTGITSRQDVLPDISELDDVTAAATALEAFTHTARFQPNANSWGDPDEFYFSASSSAIGWVIVKVDGAVSSGGYVSDAFLSCTFLFHCNRSYTKAVDCKENDEWMEMTVEHEFIYRNDRHTHGPFRKPLECFRTENPAGSGGSSGGGPAEDCPNGYWQQYFWYVDGEPVLEWWTYYCGGEEL